MKRKVGFAAVFTDITSKGALSEDASTHTVKLTAIKLSLKEIHKRWVIFTDSRSSMQSIENNEENQPILNQIYILPENQAQDKKITMCKVPAHI